MVGRQKDSYLSTVKPVLFACPLFRDLGDFAKITGRSR